NPNLLRRGQRPRLLPLCTRRSDAAASLRPKLRGVVITGGYVVQPITTILAKPHIAVAALKVVIAIAKIVAKAIHAGKVPEVARRMRGNRRILLALVEAQIRSSDLIGNLEFKGQEVDAACPEVHRIQRLDVPQIAGGARLRDESERMLGVEANFGGDRTDLCGDLAAFPAPRIDPEVRVTGILETSAQERLVGGDQGLLCLVDRAAVVAVEDGAVVVLKLPDVTRARLP